MKTLVKIFITACFSLIFVSFLHAQNKQFDIGIRSGAFIPSHWMIQGFQAFTYENGSPTDITMSGFGNGLILNLYGKFFITDHTGIMLDAGTQLLHSHKENLSLAPDGDREEYENRLTVFPLDICLIHRLFSSETKISPFGGFGFGVYISDWEQKHSGDNIPETTYTGNEMPLGIKFFSGFDFPLYHDLVFNFQFDYTYSVTDWTIKTADTPYETVYKKLNTGGISFKFGIGFKF